MRKRWAMAVLVSLLLGAAINIGIAWGLMLRYGVPTSQPKRAHGIAWIRSGPADWPAVANSWGRCDWWCCTMYDQSFTESYGEVPDGEVQYWTRIIAWGWPRPALGLMWTKGEPVSFMSRKMPDREPGIRGGLPLPTSMHHGPWATRLPIMPMWGGFLVNTVLYGVLFGSVLFGPGAIRRTLRRRRGGCIRCGYELAGLAMCPECGALRESGIQ